MRFIQLLTWVKDISIKGLLNLTQQVGRRNYRGVTLIGL